MGEWDNPYQTLDSKFEADIVRSLKGIYDKGHIHKGEKPVHWCYDCGSALAEAEVEYQDKVSKSIDVKFKVHDIDKIKTTLMKKILIDVVCYMDNYTMDNTSKCCSFY